MRKVVIFVVSNKLAHSDEVASITRNLAFWFTICFMIFRAKHVFVGDPCNLCRGLQKLFLWSCSIAYSYLKNLSFSFANYGEDYYTYLASVNNLQIVAAKVASFIPASLKLSNNNLSVSPCLCLQKRPELIRTLNLTWIRFNSSSVTSPFFFIIIKKKGDGYDHTTLFLAQVKNWASLVKEQADGYIEIKLSKDPRARLSSDRRLLGVRGALETKFIEGIYRMI